MKEAIILAGGLGTRLLEVVKDVPKPMALIGDKPFLYFLLEFLNKQNFQKVILSVGYKYQIIQEYFGKKFKNIELVYSIENEPLGTGGAIKKALEKVGKDKCFILNGDTFFNIDLNQLSLKEDSKIEIALKYMENFDRYGNVEVDENNYIVSFEEKKFKKQGNINGGVYLVKKEILDNFKENKFSFEKFLEVNFKNLRATGKVFNDYFIDIGIPSDYYKAIKELGEVVYE